MERPASAHEEQLNLLSIFHYVLAGITALFSCFPLIHLGMGIAMLTGAIEMKDTPTFVAWIFIATAAMIIFAGWTLAILMFFAGKNLRRQTAYTFCFVIAVLECMFMPLGTALGVFTIVLLTKEPVKALFSRGQVIPPPKP